MAQLPKKNYAHCEFTSRYRTHWSALYELKLRHIAATPDAYLIRLLYPVAALSGHRTKGAWRGETSSWADVRYSE